MAQLLWFAARKVATQRSTARTVDFTAMYQCFDQKLLLERMKQATVEAWNWEEQESSNINTISKHNNNNMKLCRTIIDTARALCTTAIGATPQAQRQGRGQKRHPLQAQSPGLGWQGPSFKPITRGNKTPIVNSRRRPHTNVSFADLWTTSLSSLECSGWWRGNVCSVCVGAVPSRPNPQNAPHGTSSMRPACSSP